MWKRFQESQPTEAEVQEWLASYPGCGWAIIAGKVSGNLEVIDIEAIAPIDELRERVNEVASNLLARLPIVETPSGGQHIYYRCETVGRNQKLAEREIEVPEKTNASKEKDGRYYEVKTLVETRAEGGYVLSPLCAAGVHPSGGAYRLINGNLSNIPVITEEEQETLLSAARACNEYIKQSEVKGQREAKSEKVSKNRPGDEFNQRGEVRLLLEKHGWQQVGGSSAGELWARPGVTHTSATLFSNGILYVFSTNANPLEGNRAYSPFGLYTALEHGGDFNSAAKALAKEGFGNENKEGEHDSHKSISQQLIEIVTEGSELFHDSKKNCYVSFQVSNHKETCKLDSSQFRDWLSHAYYIQTGKALRGENINETLAILRAKARYEGKEIETHIRLAEHEDAIYLDLCDAEWRQVKITENDWVIIKSKDSPVRFRRANGMLPLPVPVRDGSLAELRSLLNLEAENNDTWVLILAWLMGAFKPSNKTKFSYPLLLGHGEQGSAKSTTSRVLKNLLDPGKGGLRAAPKDERDLAISASNGLILAFDNLTYLNEKLSNALCRLSTGGGFSTRQLHTDEGEIIFDSQCPVIMNGIAEIVTKSDLLDRSILLYLPRIPEEKRKLERKIDAEFAQAHPRILGTLLDAVACGLKRMKKGIKLSDPPRMADFAEWVTACEPGLDLRDGEFMAAYTRNRNEANLFAIEASSVAQTINSLLSKSRFWFGTVGELYKALNDILVDKGEDPNRKHGWVKTPKALGAKLKEISPNLRLDGITVESGARTRNGYTIRLERVINFSVKDATV